MLDGTVAWTSADPRATLAGLKQADANLKTMKASLEMGFPQTEPPVTLWSQALLAHERDTDFLYVKGYRPLSPIDFILKSHEGRFWFFLPRAYTVFWGETGHLDLDIDTDMKLRAEDVLAAIRPVKIDFFGTCRTGFDSGRNGVVGQVRGWCSASPFHYRQAGSRQAHC